MYYAPQSWLEDFSGYTDEIVKGNEGMDIDMMSADMDQREVDEAVNSIMHTKRKYRPRTVTCQDCGAEFVGAGSVLKYCPKCKAERKRLWAEEYIQRKKKRADTKKLDAQDKSIASPVETVLLSKPPRDMRASDVPDVPQDDYDTAAEKIKKTAPIETCLVQKKEDSMDNREERLKTFPSLSSMTEHPENFTENVQSPATTYIPADNGTTAPDTKRMLMDLYGQMTAISKDCHMPVTEIIDRMTRIDSALS